MKAEQRKVDSSKVHSKSRTFSTLKVRFTLRTAGTIALNIAVDITQHQQKLVCIPNCLSNDGHPVV